MSFVTAPGHFKLYIISEKPSLSVSACIEGICEEYFQAIAWYLFHIMQLFGQLRLQDSGSMSLPDEDNAKHAGGLGVLAIFANDIKMNLSGDYNPR